MGYTDKTSYERLLQSENSIGDIEGDLSRAPIHDVRSSPFRRYLIWLAKGLAIITILLLCFSMGAYTSSSRPPVPKPRRSCSCGESVAEAMSLNCKFDGMAAAYLPPHCRDDELLDEFNRAGENPDGSWNYWADPDKKVLLNETGLAELADAVKPFYASQRWHIVHCFFNWRKGYRRPMTGITIDLETDNEAHIMHCNKVAQLGIDLDSVKTESGIAINADIIRKKPKSGGSDPTY